MARPATDQPTDVELQILRILWDGGKLTVRDIHSAIQQFKDTNYSTTVKMLSVMLEKNLVVRDENARPHVYRAAISRQKAQQQMLKGMVKKLFDGSTASLVMQALSTQKASKDELAEIRQLIEKIEKGKK